MKEDIKLAKWLNDELEGQELQEFMASPEYKTYRKIKEYSAQLRAPEADIETMYRAIERNRQPKSKLIKLAPMLSRIAAILVIALGITYFFYTTHITKEMAANGKMAYFTLPDNSSVALNSGSTAQYRAWNWQEHRKVELTGEGYFKVAKGETFDVVTNIGTVTVVGTQFDVKARDNRLDVTCYEGRVKVAYQNEVILITKGQNVAFENGKRLDIPAVDSLKPSWMGDETYFASETLSHIIGEMERRYNIDIEIKGKTSDELFTGTIPMKNLDEAFEIIKTTYKLNPEKQGGKFILTSE